MFVYSGEKDKRSLLRGMQLTGDKGRVASFLPLALLSGAVLVSQNRLAMRAKIV
jgi:hypothetical protein